MRGKRQNLIGMRFGRLLVESRSGSRRGNAVWNCICDCGKETKVTSGSLLAGRSTSCNCSRRKEHGAFYELLRRYKKNAKKRNLSFEISDDRFRELTTSNCYYCGVEPHQDLKQHAISFIYNGVDRLTNEKGYTEENSVSCCGVCNDMKGSLENELIFLGRIEKIFKHKMLGEGSDAI